MTDVLDRLARLDHATDPPAEGTVAADLVRGHAALARRRRTTGALAGVGLTLALGAGLGGVIAVQHDDSGSPVTVAPDGTPTKGGRIMLVDYDGTQPQGFEVAKVPDGFTAQGSSAFSFTVAPVGDTSSPDDFQGKLVVMLESKDAAPNKAEGQQVSVDGAPGWIRTDPDGLATTLEYFDADGHDVVVQMWRTVGLTDEQLVEFAAGITVTAQAQAGVG